MRRFFPLLVATALMVATAGCGASGGDKTAKTTTTAAPTTSASPSATTAGDSSSTTTAGDSSSTTTAGDSSSTTTAGDSSSTTTDKGPAGSGPADVYATNVAKGLSSKSKDGSDLLLDPKAARCVAPKWVDAIGLDTLQKKAPDPSDLAKSNYSYDKLGLSKDQASTMIDAFGKCGVDLYELLIRSLSVGIPKDKQTCIRRELPPDLAQKFLVAALSGDVGGAIGEKIGKIDQTCKLGSSGGKSSTGTANTVSPTPPTTAGSGN
ncbi:MAG: hypothetical protein ACR2MB_16600 [Acidimicrobiales bacterium]